MKTSNLFVLVFLFLSLSFGFSSFKSSSKMEKEKTSLGLYPKLYPKLQSYAKELASNFETIDEERKTKLQEIGNYIIDKKRNKKNIDITVICTHNSRRSHFGQTWLQIAAYYYDIERITTFSGGTESTAFNPRAVAALQRTGIKLEKAGSLDEGKNPIYLMSVGEKFKRELFMFSKKYSHKQNPQKDFAAIMVCSDADKKCPLVLGADARFAIPFEDPKVSDGTDKEAQTYDERCKQIGTEFFFVMDYVKTELSKK